MPTGYTAGILDGEIKTFKQFATLCMRAFGATVHMRDDSMDKPFEPRVPTDYHFKEIEKAEKLLADAEALNDDEIIVRRKDELLTDKKYHEVAIEKTKQNREMLIAILKDVKVYEPPTENHTGIKDFMIDQLKQTLDYDGSTKWHDEKLTEINAELESLSPTNIREQMKDKAYKSLDYHQREWAADIERCNSANKWVETFLASIEQKQQPAQ